MKLRMYSEISENRLPKVPDSFEEAKKVLADVFEGELSQNIEKYIFYGSAAKGNATVSSDLDLLLIVRDFNPSFDSEVKNIFKLVEEVHFVPVEHCLTEFDLLITKFHTLNPSYMKHVLKFNDDGDFPSYLECATLKEELKHYTASRIRHLTSHISQPKFTKKPLCNNEHFLLLVDKAYNSFSHQAMKMVDCSNDDSPLGVFEKYKEIVHQEQIDLFEESLNFRRNYDELVINAPSKKEYENFLETRGKKIIWQAIEFLKGNIVFLDENYKLIREYQLK